MRNIHFVCSFLLVLVVVGVESFGWSAHNAIGAIAQSKLTPEANNFVTNVLKSYVGPDGTTFTDLLSIASYADRIITNYYTWSKTWHYADVTAPRSPDSQYNHTRDCASGCIVTAIQNYTNLLLTTPMTDTNLIGDALMFTTHFFGDLHQPLHAGYLDDIGGNKVTVFLQDTWSTTPLKTNLHGVWDYVLVAQYMNRTNLLDDQSLANNIIGKITNDQNAKYFVAEDVMNIIPVSHRLAVKLYDDLASYNVSSLDLSYHAASMPTIIDQMIAAGLRLAATLNKIAALRQQPTPIINTASITTYMDTMFQATDALKNLQLSNVVVSVMNTNGTVYLDKGYTTSSNAAPTSSNVFAISSLTRVFTATALMQLVEQNKLSLSDTVNDVLNRYKAGIRIKSEVVGNVDSWSGTPKIQDVNDTTVHNLLTHTGGYDHIQIGLASRAAISPSASLQDTLQQRLPPKVRKINEISVESDYGVTLLGYLVEVISGQPFGAYLQQNIFDKLQMTSSFYQANNSLLSSSSMRFDSGEQYPYINPAPSKAMWSSTQDLNKFLSGLMTNKLFTDANTVNTMFAERFGNVPSDANVGMRSSVAALWYKSRRNAVSYVYQTGEIGKYRSAFAIYPDQNIAVSLLGTGDANSTALKIVLDKFVDSIIAPYTCSAIPPQFGFPFSLRDGECSHVIDSVQRTSQTGCYTLANYEHTSWFKVQSILEPKSKICLSSHGNAIHVTQYAGKSIVSEYDLVQYPTQSNSSTLFFVASKANGQYLVKAMSSSVYFKNNYLILDGNTVYERMTDTNVLAIIVCMIIFLCIAFLVPSIFMSVICFEVCRDCRRSRKGTNDIINDRMGERYEMNTKFDERLIDEDDDDNLKSSRGYIWDEPDTVKFGKKKKKEIIDADIVFEDVQNMTLRRAPTMKTIKFYSKSLLCSVLFFTMFSTLVIILTSLANLTHISYMLSQTTMPQGLYDVDGTLTLAFLSLGIANCLMVGVACVCLLIMALLRIFMKPSIGGWIFNILYFLGVMINILYIPLAVYLNWYKQNPTPLGL